MEASDWVQPFPSIEVVMSATVWWRIGKLELGDHEPLQVCED